MTLREPQRGWIVAADLVVWTLLAAAVIFALFTGHWKAPVAAIVVLLTEAIVIGRIEQRLDGPYDEYENEIEKGS